MNLEQAVFTGIVQDIGQVVAREERGGDIRMTFALSQLDPAGFHLGDSICVQGCCLTVVDLRERRFAADVSRETLALTTLGEFAAGARVNLEPSLRVGDALGGHLVSGHIDGLGRVVAMHEDARSSRLEICVPDHLARYVARKGSVAVDGVSLTVNDVRGSVFGVNLIPHTRAVTTLGALSVGARVNIEVDQMARYAERLLGETGREDPAC